LPTGDPVVENFASDEAPRVAYRAAAEPHQTAGLYRTLARMFRVHLRRPDTATPDYLTGFRAVHRRDYSAPCSEGQCHYVLRPETDRRRRVFWFRHFVGDASSPTIAMPEVFHVGMSPLPRSRCDPKEDGGKEDGGYEKDGNHILHGNLPCCRNIEVD